MTTREVEWDEEQQAIMLALDLYRSLIHAPCGGYLPDTTAAEAVYKADIPVRCKLCTALAEAHTDHMKAPHAPHPEALLWPVRRRWTGG